MGDHPADLVLDGLRAALAGTRDVEVVGWARDGIAAMRLLREARPDVAIVDLHMPRKSGLDVLRAAAHEELAVRVLIVTSFDDDATYRDALAAGARGFLGKESGIARLLEAVRALARGETFFESGVSERARRALTPSEPRTGAPSRRESPLTPREREVLRLIATGLSNREIAFQLGTTEGTVKNHTSSILTKLDVRDRTRAVLVALRDGWI
jgi:DNA-binding NarL/FixJ family response regulator